MRKSFKYSYPIFFLLISFIIGCETSKTEESVSAGNSVFFLEDLKHEKSDLLAGVSRAVCYSGFREGQHPDRGDGAVNPSYEEVLEDLQIISRQFKIIRLYDSGENTKMVLDLSVINVYNRENVFYVDLVTNEVVYQLPFMPSIGLSVYF
jgi:hypothetical protein